MSTNANRREQLRRQQEAMARAQRTRRTIGIVAGVVALLLLGVLVFVLVGNNTRPTTGVGAAPPTAPLAPQVTPVAANADADALVIAQGRPGTPVVTLYLDYQCPNCRVFEQSFGPMLVDTARAGEWTLQYKTMTFMDVNLQNTSSTRAALGASCAATLDADTYAAYHDQVFAHQAPQEVRGVEGYTDELLRDAIPATVGITEERLADFRACYDGRATQDFVAAVEASANRDGVNATPTLAVNGHPVDFNQVDPLTPDGLRAHLLANA